jgi:serine/threonine protein kinase
MTLSKGDLCMGRYRIMGPLAEGGMGMVYLARIEGAEGFARPAVIKQILPTLRSDEEMVRMFVREARILASLHHPNIVDVLDFASEGGTFLMALEYVHGYGVNQWSKYLRDVDRQMPVWIAVWIIVQVLDALHYAHTRTDPQGKSLGIVHRDVSPSNILLDVEGHVRLVDFGVAREMGEHTAPKPGEVSIRGKFPYMAPELLSGAEPNAESDLYACAVALHEMLLGENEFRHRDPNVTIKRVFMHELSRISKKIEGVPVGLDNVIAKATAKLPESRYKSAEELSEALRALFPSREAHLQQELRTILHADFFGPMPDALGVSRLEALEESWRSSRVDTPMVRPEEQEKDRPRLSENPTQTAPRVVVSSGGPLRWILGIAAVLALVTSVVVLVIVLNAAPNDGPERVVVVERRLVEPRDSAEPADVADAGAVSSIDAGPAAAPVRSAPTRAAQLTARFGRQQPRLRACFEQHARTLEGQPRIAVRFRVGVTGAVESAELTPSELAPTPLGRCLLGVATSTEFGPQPDPIGFSIPIAVRGG